MTPDEIPQELVDLLDERAGKQHSCTGPVLATLAEILTRFEASLRQSLRVAGPVLDDGVRRVYATDDGRYVISEHGAWLPGAYADINTAMAAFEVDDEVLVALRDRVTPAPGRGAITLDMLKEAS